MKLVCCLLLAASLSVSAQSTPKSILFEGAQQYSQQGLLATTGLTPGKLTTKAEIDAALHHLDDTGLFANIRYTLSSTVLTFQLTPVDASQLLQVHFINFVVIPRATLDADLHQRLPLYTGVIPVSGDLQQTLERTLEAILHDHGLEATVRSIGGKGRVLDYAIATPQILVGNVSIANAPFDSDPNFTAIRKRISGSQYSDDFSADALRTNLLEAWQDQAYLDAAVGPITPSAPRPQPGRLLIDLSGTATPGQPYRVATLTLPVSPLVPPAEMERAGQLKAGAPASRVLLIATQTELAMAFQNRGYLDAAITTTTDKNTATHSIAYTLQATPGEPYRFRTLLFVNVAPEQQNTLTKTWKLTPGEPFKLSALDLFRATPAAKSACAGHPIQAAIKADRTDHQADVALACN